MTKDETRTFLESIIGIYPNFQYVGTPTLNAWFNKLQDVPYKSAETALERYFEKGEEFPPNLVKIVKLLPKSGIAEKGWVYEQDQYGFEYVVKEIQNNDGETVEIRRSIKQRDADTYEDKDGYLWAINDY